MTHPLSADVLASPRTLRAPGPRERVRLAEAADIASRWEAQLASHPDAAVTTIDLSCRAWPVESLRVLEPVLVRVRSTVETLKIDDVIASLLTDDGFETLRFFADTFRPDRAPRVANVFLSYNALGSRFLDEDFDMNCRALIGHPNLRRLDFNNTGMSIAVCEVLLAMLRDSAAKLKELRLGKNQMHPEGAAAVAKLLPHCTGLEQFDYGGSRPLREGTASFVGGLVAMLENAEGGETPLEELNLRDCFFGDGGDDEDAVHELCRVIRASPGLKRLNVWDGQLDLDGLELVVAALVDSGARLESLDVGGLCICEEGAEALASFIRDHQKFTLVELNAEDNQLEDGGLDTLLPVLVECPNLRCLNLSGNEFTEDGYRAIADNPIPCLRKLYAKDDMAVEDLDEELIEEIRGMYPTVYITDGDAVEEDVRNVNFAWSVDYAAPGAAGTEAAGGAGDADAEVDALADALGGARI